MRKITPFLAFQLNGTGFMAINGGPVFTFTPAISISTCGIALSANGTGTALDSESNTVVAPAIGYTPGVGAMNAVPMR